MNATNRTLLVLTALILCVAAALWLTKGGHPDAPPAGSGADDAARTAGLEPGKEVETSAALDRKVADTDSGDARRSVDTGAASAKFRVSGTVVLPDGAVAANTALRFVEGVVGEGTRIRMPRRADGAVRETVPSGTPVRTDAAGKFEFFVAANASGRLRPETGAMYFDGDAGHDGFVPPVTADLDLGRMTLSKGAELAGLVRGPAGEPLADVSVSLQRGGVDAFPFLLGGERAVTAADGTFRFPGVRPGAYRLATASSRHVPAQRSIEVKSGVAREEVTIDLQEGGFVAGTVVDDLGRPIADARVALHRNQELGAITYQGTRAGESARTDASGRFVLGGVTDASVTLSANHGEHAPMQKSDVPLRSTDVVLTMSRYGVIRGVVVDELGKPVEGTTVSVRPSVGDRNMRFLTGGGTETGADGAFAIAKVAPGDVALIAEGPTHVASTPLAVAVRAGEATTDVRIVVQRGATLVVTVLDPKGRPVVGADVEVRAPDDGPAANGFQFGERVVTRRARGVRMGGPGGPGPGDAITVMDGASVGTGKTDVNGVASIGGLKAGAYDVQARHADLASPPPRRVTVPATGSTPVELTLIAGGFVELTVVDADGKPKADAAYRLVGQESIGAAPRSGSVDATGKQRIGPLTPGEYTLMLQTPMRPIEAGGARIVMAGGMGTDLESTRTKLNVVAEQATPIEVTYPIFAAVHGMVRDTQGPVANAQVELSIGDTPRLPFGGATYSGRTDNDGNYRIEDVPPGDYTIAFGRRGAVMMFEEECKLVDGVREVRKDLTIDGATLLVKVTDPDGQPIVGAKVTVARSGGTRPRRETAAVMMVRTIGDGDGGMESLTVGNDLGSAKTDHDGIARIVDLPPGKVGVTIEHSKHARHRTPEVDLIARRETDLGTVQMTGAGQVRGTVVDAAGAVVEMARVEMRLLPSGTWESAMAFQGSFQFTGVAPGNYEVRALSPGGEGGRERAGVPTPIEVKTGETVRPKVVAPAN